MFKLKWLVVLVLFLFAVPPSYADDHTKLLGTWKLVSWESEFQATGERELVLGKSPTGYSIFTREGRMMTVLTGEGRTAPKTDLDRANLFKSMLAYTGMFRIEGDKMIIKVDGSWNPAWMGTEQVRFLKFDGDRFHVLTPWMKSTLRPEKGMTRVILTFERAK